MRQQLGETALIVAVQQRQAQFVNLLLDAGANPDKTDNAAGFRARDYAKRDRARPEMLALIEGEAEAQGQHRALDN